VLRITIQETEDSIVIQLEGRIVGPWVAELGNAWAQAALQLNSRKLSIDLCNVTYADRSGKRVLRSIYAQTGALLIATTQWARFLAGEIADDSSDRIEAKSQGASDE
jgi:anti-anti-sigma regulatory factor